MKKRFKMVMLPTEKASQIAKSKSTGQLNYPVYVDKNFDIGQYLYIVDTQATIEVGDFIVILDGVNSIEKCFEVRHTEEGRILINGFFKDNIRGPYIFKVVASTGTSPNLPAIPEQLVKEYVEQQFEYVPEKWRLCNNCSTFKTGTQEGLCSTCGRFGKTNKELALEWWNRLSVEGTKFTLVHKYLGADRHWTSLTGTEIEQIWMQEIISNKTSRGADYINEKGELFDFKLNQYSITPDKCLPQVNFDNALCNNCNGYGDECDCGNLQIGHENYHKLSKPQVDFEMLKDLISDETYCSEISQDDWNNLILFFNMLKKSSSFAHKAHKALRD